uniref:Uncharacterized protein n=1 Tax=Arundo donax TaxID=35708 RepID=A0A0A8ZYK6_ARUDO
MEGSQQGQNSLEGHCWSILTG